LGLDILALRDAGARAVTVVAGVSAQDRSGVHAMLSVPPDVIVAQLRSLADASIAVYRIGALLDCAGVDAVATWLEGVRTPSVYDPVIAPTGGGRFADDATVEAIRRRLLPRVTLATPNFAEALRLVGGPHDEDDSLSGAAMECEPGRAGVKSAAGRAGANSASGHGGTNLASGLAGTNLASAHPGVESAWRLAGGESTVPAMEQAARALVSLGTPAVLVTGGDLPGRAVDVLVDAEGSVVFEAPRLPGTLRGTGCLLSCGIAAALAHGATLRDAVAQGRDFVRERFEHASDIAGMRTAY
jgi:hydroxymethylpyrimidine/phosphomethylpyrimidine kinase